MIKPVQVELVPREKAERLSHIMGRSSAAAAALRALEQMGNDATNFEICRDIKNQMLILIDKKYLADAALSFSPADSDGTE